MDISPEAQDALRSSLRDTSARVVIELRVSFERVLAIGGSRTASMTKARELSRAQRSQLLHEGGVDFEGLDDVGLGAGEESGAGGVPSESGPRNASAMLPEVTISGLFPKLVRLPSVADADPIALTGSAYRWHTMQSMRVTPVGSGERQQRPLQNSEAMPWWLLQQAGRDLSPFNTTASDGLQLIVAGERLAGGSAAASFTSGGVVAFYVLVVYAIGRVVQAALRGGRYRLIVDEMPEVRDLVDLCDGVYIARHEGQLTYEAELHETILRLYRSPVSLLQLTGDRLHT